MAPEQAAGRNKQIGPATDVYALGALLCELLTGSPPYSGETVLETLELVRTAARVELRARRADLPLDLATICLKCLRKDPADRYASAGALAVDLRRYLAGQPIAARPVSWRDQFTHWCRRPERVRQAGYTMTAFAVILLTFFFSAATLWYFTGRMAASVPIFAFLGTYLTLYLGILWAGLRVLRQTSVPALCLGAVCQTGFLTVAWAFVDTYTATFFTDDLAPIADHF